MSANDKIDKCLEGIHRIEVNMTRMESDLKRNTDDMGDHIRRTNLLEKKMSKIYMVMLMGAGFALATAGPHIAKLIGLLL